MVTAIVGTVSLVLALTVSMVLKVRKELRAARQDLQVAKREEEEAERAIELMKKQLEEKTMPKPIPGLPLRRFECTTGRSNKYWEVWTEENAAITHWGRISTAGQFQRKEFSSAFFANKYYMDMIQEKLKKGYVESRTSAVKTWTPIAPLVDQMETPDIQLERIESPHVEEKQKRAFKF